MSTFLKYPNVLLAFCFFSLNFTIGQNTVGLISLDKTDASVGYKLIYPFNQEKVFLLNICGEVVHEWSNQEDYRPGNVAYLREDGALLRTSRINNSVNDTIWAPGGGATVELVDWDSNVLWSYTLNDGTSRLHHDVVSMPNGNILMIAWERKTEQEAILAGRDPIYLSYDYLLPDFILEINPSSDEIVWEWHVWDHLIQDYDPLVNNFGTISQHPELIDINLTPFDGKADWLHSNAIDYNEDLDQIVLSVPNLNEIWIIDHSTTTAQAASHSGGKSEKGGDLLYRWGNPINYKRGTIEDQKFFFQHNIRWNLDFIDPQNDNYGKFSLFNNRVDDSFSAVSIFKAKFDTLLWSYPLVNNVWGPVGFDKVITHPIPEKMQSDVLSSAQLLQNDHILVCAGRYGDIFEFNLDGDVVWQYNNPLKGGLPVDQGTIITSGNLLFNSLLYPLDYKGFDDMEFTPIGYLETAPDTSFCSELLFVEDVEMNDFLVYPNPANQVFNIQSSNIDLIMKVDLYDFFGNKVLSFHDVNIDRFELDVLNVKSGLYLLIVNGKFATRISVID